MFTEKELLFNWTIPTTRHGGRKLNEDLRLNVKHNYVYLNVGFLQENFPDDTESATEVRAAFVNLDSDGKAYMVINPIQGVPFFKFRIRHYKDRQSTSITLYSKDLITLFKNKYMLQVNAIASFRLNPFQKFKDMMFYSIDLL